MAEQTQTNKPPVTIKKYANRRLYNTATSSYVTLDHLCQMVKEGTDFVVYDAKTGEDITRSVLTQIIVDQESKEGGANLLPVGFLKNLIGFYGDNMQGVVPNYLEQTLEVFVKNQEQLRENITKSLEGIPGMSGMFPQVPGVANFEDITRKNMEMFENAMKMFKPFNMNFAAGQKQGEKD